MNTTKMIRNATESKNIGIDYPYEVRSFCHWPIEVDVRINTNTGRIITLFYHVNKGRISRKVAEQYLQDKTK
jgi:hypothetical protein